MQRIIIVRFLHLIKNSKKKSKILKKRKKLNGMKKIMVIADHPDDEMLGCGGTLIKHSKNGDYIKMLLLGQGMLSRGGG